MQLHTRSGTVTMRTTLRALAARLDPRVFIRIHRSTVVRAERVRCIEPAFRNEDVAVLVGGTRLTVSRNYRTGVRRYFGSE